MAAIPLIQLETDDTGRRTAARAIDAACRDIGFFGVASHGVPAATIADMWAASRAFFDLPADEKRRVEMPYNGYPYGYSPYLNEGLAQSRGDAAPPDLKESFNMGPPVRPAALPPGADAAFAFADTPWPTASPGFRAAWEAYYGALNALAGRLMSLFALALDLDPDFFDDKIDRHISALRAIDYPHPMQAPMPGQLRAGAHSDYGSLTILLQEDAPGGLQVRDRSGAWRDVPHVPGAFVVNIGDLMARWTNDRWVSTLHRVVNPPADAGGSTRRQSVAFFHQPNWDAQIECIPSCLAPGEQPKYAPVGSGAYLMAKFQSTVGLDAGG